jgi:hypothetical protein
MPPIDRAHPSWKTGDVVGSIDQWAPGPRDLWDLADYGIWDLSGIEICLPVAGQTEPPATEQWAQRAS